MYIGKKNFLKRYKTLLNIFHSFIPNKIILCDDNDIPWLNDAIKNFIKTKNGLSCQANLTMLV